MTVNERLLEAAIRRAIDTQQYSNGVERRMIALLNRADADLMARLAAALSQLPAESFTVARLEALIVSVRALNASVYQSIGDALSDEVRRFASIETGYQYRLFQSAISAEILQAVALTAVSSDQAYAAALARPFQGRLLSEWAQSIGDDRMRRIREAIRIGYVSQETNDDIIRRIRGTRARQYSDGIIEADRRTLATIVSTAVSHTAASAKERFYEANGSLIKALRWTSTLDGRTSAICIARDGKMYGADDKHRPIGHSLPWLGGAGKAHFNCRSVMTPVLKSWKELGGADISEFSPSTRASMDGQVPDDTDYPTWFAKQSAARQDQIVGKTRGLAYRRGDVTFDRFTNDKGRWLTLDELTERGVEL